MRDLYTDRLDKEIERLIGLKTELSKNPDLFKNETGGIKIFKTKKRQEFSLDTISGEITGLIQAKALYYRVWKAKK